MELYPFYYHTLKTLKFSILCYYFLYYLGYIIIIATTVIITTRLIIATITVITTLYIISIIINFSSTIF